MQPLSIPTNKRNIFWRAYFMLMLIIFGLSALFGEHSVIELAKTIFFAFGLVCLWGLIHNKAIGWRPLWAVYFVLVMAGALYTIADLAFGAGSPWPSSIWLAALVGLALTTPQWLALWLYAFRRPLIWHPASEDA